MSKRRLPVRPDCEFLRREAKELLSDYRREKPAAVEDFGAYHPTGVTPREAKLSDAQLALALSYRFANWARLQLAAELCRAMYSGDAESASNLCSQYRFLLDEPARGSDTGASWGTPYSYARFLGRQNVVDALLSLDAGVIEQAKEVTRSQLADWFVRKDGTIEPGAVMNPCETLNADGLEFLLSMGAELADADGDSLGPVAVILQTYTRFPEGKHRCLEICESNGIAIPDTPLMAFHFGRIEWLQRHFERDPSLLSRTFSHEEIYPRELGCSDRSSGLGLHGTPLHGTTLLHLAIDFDEFEIARWLVEKGANVNGKAEIDKDGFGGHTPLFGTVVSQPAHNGRQADGEMTQWLLQQGAQPNERASLRKGIRFHGDKQVYEYHNVTPLEWGRQFHSRALVNEAAMRVIRSFCDGDV
ncbi:MAG: ankyrin repeat domain-containing protein [Planctomycetota bacterium]